MSEKALQAFEENAITKALGLQWNPNSDKFGFKIDFTWDSAALTQIEACFNSRPLQPLTADTENINALTPGHFLIGDALMAPPQPCMLDINANRLDCDENISRIYIREMYSVAL